MLFKGECFDAECIEIVRSRGVPTALWQHDVFLEFPPWLRALGGQIDFLFTHARGMVRRFKEAGFRNTDWLLEGFPESSFTFDHIDENQRKQFTCQVAFVGNIHMNVQYRKRALMIRRAIEEGFTVKWWGPHIARKLKHFPLIFSRVGRAYGGRMLANADFAKAVTCTDINLARDEHPEIDASVSNRLYWTCGSGGFYLSHTSAGIEDIMIPGKEIDTFDSLDEMAEKIRYYLDHPEERRRIAEAGQRRTLENYTLRHSMTQMLERLRAAKIV